MNPAPSKYSSMQTKRFNESSTFLKVLDELSKKEGAG